MMREGLEYPVHSQEEVSSRRNKMIAKCHNPDPLHGMHSCAYRQSPDRLLFFATPVRGTDRLSNSFEELILNERRMRHILIRFTAAIVRAVGEMYDLKRPSTKVRSRATDMPAKAGGRYDLNEYFHRGGTQHGEDVNRDLQAKVFEWYGRQEYR
eukprot:4128348-Amphidinium_carterae.1